MCILPLTLGVKYASLRSMEVKKYPVLTHLVISRAVTIRNSW